MLIFLTLILAASRAVQAPGPHALTARDALARLPMTRDPIHAVGDVDGDGSPEVVLRHTVDFGYSFDVVSARDGAVLCHLWRPGSLGLTPRDMSWDVRGDCDGDGVFDLVVGFPWDSAVAPGAGAVVVLSGATGEVLAHTRGAAQGEHYGTSLAFLGDIDGDGRDDVLVGSSQVTYPKTSASTNPGFVTARSGGAAEILWEATGFSPGQAFGRRVCAVGDLDGDGVVEAVVQCEQSSSDPIRLLSGSTGQVLAYLDHEYGPVGPAGDLDGDGWSDLCLDSRSSDGMVRGSAARIVSGRNLGDLGSVNYPDFWGDGVSVAVGDVDLDGFDDLAVGEPNYNLDASVLNGLAGAPANLGELPLSAVLAFESRPNTMTYESGCLLVVSGRTRRPIWGFFGEPGSRDGAGFGACAIPDISGDGGPEVVVTCGSAVYVLPGPGPAGRQAR